MCNRKKGDIIESNYEHRKNWDDLREKAGLIVRDTSGRIIRNDWVGGHCEAYSRNDDICKDSEQRSG